MTLHQTKHYAVFGQQLFQKFQIKNLFDVVRAIGQIQLLLTQQDKLIFFDIFQIERKSGLVFIFVCMVEFGHFDVGQRGHVVRSRVRVNSARSFPHESSFELAGWSIIRILASFFEASPINLHVLTHVTFIGQQRIVDLICVEILPHLLVLIVSMFELLRQNWEFFRLLKNLENLTSQDHLFQIVALDCWRKTFSCDFGPFSSIPRICICFFTPISNFFLFG